MFVKTASLAVASTHVVPAPDQFAEDASQAPFAAFHAYVPPRVAPAHVPAIRTQSIARVLIVHTPVAINGFACVRPTPFFRANSLRLGTTLSGHVLCYYFP